MSLTGNNQSEGNEMRSQIDTMLSGLNGMVEILEKQIKDHKKTLTTDQAIEFKKAMEGSALADTLKKYETVSKDLKRELNID